MGLNEPLHLLKNILLPYRLPNLLELRVTSPLVHTEALVFSSLLMTSTSEMALRSLHNRQTIRCFQLT